MSKLYQKYKKIANHPPIHKLIKICQNYTKSIRKSQIYLEFNAF